MTFEEWYSDFLHYEGEPTKDIAKQAWEVAFEEGYKFANKENEDYDKIGV